MSTFPIPPLNDSSNKLSRVWHMWYDNLRRFLADTTGLIPWTSINKAGSNLTEITTRNHADLQNINTATYTHLTAVDHTDLTDAGDSALHFHSSDRDRANHTGTQLAATISDFAEAAQDAIGGSLTDTASVNLTYNDAGNTISADVLPAGVDHALLGNLNSATYSHLSSTQKTDLTDGGDTLLHYHLRHDVTGILTGGVLSVSVGGTTFSITDGTGQVVDNFTAPLSPTITQISWSGKTNITDTFLSDPATYVLLSSAGAVLQQNDAPTDDDLRDKILVGVIAHSNSLIIAFAPLMVAAYNNGNLAQDILTALGTITTGCIYSGNAALTMARTSGSIFRRGAQYLTDAKTPNAVDLALQNPVQFASYCRNGSNTVFSNSAVGTTLTANRYDDGTAAPAGVPNGVVLNNRWQAIRLFLSTNGFTLLQYGQTTYNSLNDAVEGVGGESWFQAPITRLTAFRGYLFVRGGASNLSNISDAFFQSAGKLGDVGTVGGASVFDHNSLTGLQGGTASEYYHLTSAQHTDLTDSGDSALHFHATDRARANHTGTQTMSTISDLPVLARGTYTPTLTNVANLDASTAFQCQWSRVGSAVTVSGRVDVDPTLTATSTQLGISLPVASNLGATEDCAGVAAASGIAGQVSAIRGDAVNDRAEMIWVASDVTNQPMYFTFQYEVI